MPADLQRKLTTILSADAAGYSRAMARDEPGTVTGLRAARGVFSRFIDRHGGRIANTAGDGLIAEFPSVVEAVQCAIEVQNELSAGEASALRFRIGIHLGDVFLDGEDLLGDGVNVAARLQGMADPGGVLISRQVYDQVHSKLTVGFQHLGERQARNLPEDVDVYRVAIGAAPAPPLEDEVDDAVYLSPPAAKSAAPLPPSPPKPTPQVAPESAAPASPPPQSRRSEPTAPELARPAVAGIVPRTLLTSAGVLLLIDLLSGPGFWAHWAILPLLVAFALQAAPRYETETIGRNTLRAGVIAIFLVLINLFSWSGTFWAIWPVGAIAISLFLTRKPASKS